MSMFSPETLMWMQGAGVGMNTIGSFFATQAQQSSLKYQAAINNINANMSEIGAQNTTLEGQKSAQAALMRGSRINASYRAHAAANGVDIGQGSALETQVSNEFMSHSDAISIEQAAARSAIGYRTQAVGYRNQALMENATASALSPFGSAFGSLLSGAGQVASYWGMYNQYSPNASTGAMAPIVDKSH
jgi:hypothetical protein